MKKNNILWAALSMTAALVMTACSSDDNDMTEAPVAPSTMKKIPYTVTVGGDEATTRATVDSDNKTLKFATDDKLYITGNDIHGVLNLQAGDAGKATGATFSGELTYSGSGSPAYDLPLTATLVSAQQTVGTQVSVDAAGAVTVNYPTEAYCATINDAVQQYSRLTGASTYGAKAFTLTQQTAFLNFVITFEDGTATDTELLAVVSNGGSAVCTANVTTATESEKVVAKFVLPVAIGTTLSSATVTMGSKAALNITNATLTGKVYNVTKTQAAAAKTLAEVTAGDIGKVVCAAGHLHLAKTAVPIGCTAVGILGKVTAKGHGLILALKDAATKQKLRTIIDSWTSVDTYAGTTLKQLPNNTARSPLTSYTTLGSITVSNWCVAQKSDYEAIFINLGSINLGEEEYYSNGYTYDDNVNAYITTGVGGTAISAACWSATESVAGSKGWIFGSLGWNPNSAIGTERFLRPVLGF